MSGNLLADLSRLVIIESCIKTGNVVVNEDLHLNKEDAVFVVKINKE